MKKVGRQGRENAKANRDGDKVIRAAGVQGCEIGLAGICNPSIGLTRAHRKKRRFCDHAERRIYCIACIPCHDAIERLSHEAMFRIVNQAINNRS